MLTTGQLLLELEEVSQRVTRIEGIIRDSSIEDGIKRYLRAKVEVLRREVDELLEFLSEVRVERREM